MKFSTSLTIFVCVAAFTTVFGAPSTESVCRKAQALYESNKAAWCKAICAVSGRNGCIVSLCLALEDVCEANSTDNFARALLANTLTAFGAEAQDITDLTAKEFALTLDKHGDSLDGASEEELKADLDDAILSLTEGKEGAVQFATQVLEQPNELAQRVVELAGSILGDSAAEEKSKRGFAQWFRDNVRVKFTTDDPEGAKKTISDAITRVSDAAHKAIGKIGNVFLNAIGKGDDDKRDMMKRQDSDLGATVEEAKASISEAVEEGKAAVLDL